MLSVATPTEASAAVPEHPGGNAGVAAWRCSSQCGGLHTREQPVGPPAWTVTPLTGRSVTLLPFQDQPFCSLITGLAGNADGMVLV